MAKSRNVDTSEESRRQLDLLLQYLEGPAFWTSLKQENTDRYISTDAGRARYQAEGKGPTAMQLSAKAPATGRGALVASSLSKGVPIASSTTQGLRRVIHGSTNRPFSGEWQNSSLGFFPTDSPLSFGIRARRHAARGLYMCLQGFVLRHLLFPDLDDTSNGRGNLYHRASCKPNERSPLTVSPKERSGVLVEAMADILWRAADGKDAVVCTLCDGDDFAPSMDVVEKMQMKSFHDRHDLVAFLAANVAEYEKETSPGCIMLLCSVVLSRGIDRVESELNKDICGSATSAPSLLNSRQELRSSCLNLLLAGEAAYFFHNGVICSEAESPGHSGSMKVGVSHRSDVGFLYWNGDEPSDNRTVVGSMLKTPRYPVWVTMVDGTFGLLFNMRADLVSDWHAEHLFTLSYYNGLDVLERAFTRLTVNTRVGRQWPASRVLREEMERSMPPLEHCILTKWPDADIQWPEAARPFL